MHAIEAYAQLPIYAEGLPDSLVSIGEYEMSDSSPYHSPTDSETVNLYRSYYLQLSEVYSFEELKQFIEENELPSIASIFPDETVDYESEYLSKHQSDCSAHCEEFKQSAADQPSANGSSDCQSSYLDSSSEHLPSEQSPEDARDEVDYSQLMDDTPAEPFVFDPAVAYRENVCPYQDDPYDVFLDLSENGRLSAVGVAELKKKIEAMRHVYEKLSGKLKKLKQRMNSQSSQIRALNRVVLRMQFHEDKLSNLVPNLAAKVSTYQNALESNSYDPHEQRIQRLIDFLYNPFNEFIVLVNQSASQGGAVDRGYLDKLQSNLERLCSIYDELKSIKYTVKWKLGKRERLIDELRPAIVRDALAIYSRLLSEQYDFSSTIGGYRQESIAKSFYRLLKTIS